MTNETTDGSADVLAQPVSVLNLSVRSRKRVALIGAETLDDLTKRTAADLLEIRGFGELCLREVREKLAAHNLKLNGDA